MTDPKKPPAFYCPACGQKHRTNLDGLSAAPDSVAHLTCAGCKASLALRLGDDGKPACTLEDPGDTPPASEASPAPQPKSAPPAAPRSKGKSKSKAKSKRVDKPEEAAESPSSKDGAKPEKDTTSKKQAADLVGEFAKGDELGRYTIESVGGIGGTSTVYSAFDPTTNRSVALKVLAKDSTDVMRSRFLREIEVQANIRHQNIMPVFDRGELDDGRPFFTMEKLYKPWTCCVEMRKRESSSSSQNLRTPPWRADCWRRLWRRKSPW